MHLLVVIGNPTVNTPLRREAPVRLDNLVRRNACPPLEGVDVLRKARAEESMRCKQPDK